MLELTREAATLESYRTQGTIPAHMRAATVELRHVAGYLGTMPETCELNPRNAILCELAAIAAPEVEIVASRIEAMVEAVEAGRLPVGPIEFPEGFKLVVLANEPSAHSRWKAAAGDWSVNTWLRQLADQASSSNPT